MRSNGSVEIFAKSLQSRCTLDETAWLVKIEAIVQPRFAMFGGRGVDWKVATSLAKILMFWHCWWMCMANPHSLSCRQAATLTGRDLGAHNFSVTCAAFLSIPIPSASLPLSGCSLQRNRHLPPISSSTSDAAGWSATSACSAAVWLVSIHTHLPDS